MIKKRLALSDPELVEGESKGFTLAELLVVIAILSLVGVLVTVIFTRSLRGSNKSQILLAVKQNGQSVLETVDKNIRNADNVVCPFFISKADTTTPSSDTIVTLKNGLYTRYRFIPPGNTNLAKGDCKSSNGCFLQDNPVQPSPPAPESDVKLFINGLCINPLENPKIMTDTNPQTGISLTNGSFIRRRQAGFKDIVSIKFDLSPGLGAPQAVAGQIDPVTFQTTIELR